MYNEKVRNNFNIVFHVRKWERVRNKVRNNPEIASHVWKWQGGSVRCVGQGIYANTGNAQACRECRIYLRSILLSAISLLDKLKFSERIETNQDANWLPVLKWWSLLLLYDTWHISWGAWQRERPMDPLGKLIAMKVGSIHTSCTFYRTRVRSLAMLVSDWLTNSLTD